MRNILSRFLFVCFFNGNDQSPSLRGGGGGGGGGEEGKGAVPP